MACTAAGTTRAASLAVGDEVLHVGACGACSNAADLDLYRRTADTLTDEVTGCAFRSLVGGDEAALACLERDVGFTPPCARCWADNIRCTRTHCRDVCLRSRLLGRAKGRVNEDGTVELDACLACDEVQCGAAFVACAGANRRRAGVRSDIPRPDDQLWKPPGDER